MSNIATLNLESVSLAEFNRLRNPRCPIPERTLRHMAQNNSLPGVIKLGGRYRVVLAIYDQAVKDQIAGVTVTGLSGDDDLTELANQIEAALRGSAK